MGVVHLPGGLVLLIVWHRDNGVGATQLDVNNFAF